MSVMVWNGRMSVRVYSVVDIDNQGWDDQWSMCWNGHKSGETESGNDRGNSIWWYE